MSVFREVEELNLLDTAEPLPTSGSTCLCYKLKIYGRWQFVKRLKPELAHNARYISLFTKEFMVGSRLNHPNIVRYNEMETTDDGVMMMLDYVEGKTLSEILADNPGYFAEKKHLERFCFQLLAALDYMHSQQVLHLDLKPDNVMVTRVDEDVKLLDLGFCRTDTYTDSEGKTAGFDAPEQKDGDTTLRVDARTDIYGFGRLLEEINKALVKANNKALPAKYQSLMKQCLDENPEKRPQHASDCAKLLRRGDSLKIGGASLLFLLFAMSLLVWLHEPTRSALQYSMRHFQTKGYNWIAYGCKMHILSDDDMTCEVVGWSLDYDGNPNVMMPAESSFFGRKFKVQGIAEKAFDDCDDMETVFLPEGLTSIGARAFRDCDGLNMVNIPNSVKQLGDEVFSKCKNLQSVFLSKQLTALPEHAFVDCYSLRSIELPEGIVQIGVDCFVSDTSLVEISLPQSLRRIDRGVFFNCTSLQQITLPSNLETIGEYCFYGCTSLTDLYFQSAIPPVAVESFDRKDIRIHVPAGCEDAYRQNTYWKNFTIVE